MLKKLTYCLIAALQLSSYCQQIILSETTMDPVVFQQFKDSLINEPEKLLQKHIASLEAVRTKKKADDLTPFSSLMECYDEICPLTRAYSPQGAKHRNTFEKAVATSLVKISQQKPRINYADVGAGRLFATARVLTLAHLLGLKEIDLSVIDQDYSDFVQYFTAKKMQKVDIAALPMSPFSLQATFKAFLTYVNTLFGEKNIAVDVHNPQTFFEKINNRPFPLHVITSSDAPGQTFHYMDACLGLVATPETELYYLYAIQSNPQEKVEYEVAHFHPAKNHQSPFEKPHYRIKSRPVNSNNSLLLEDRITLS
jgi:hypothetical protein